MAIVETKAGAYKGIPLLLVSSSIAGGRKDVLFEYPNSDRQFVEDQGLRKRVYTMRIVVPHTDFIETRDDILRVLEEGGVGPLDHPYYGRIENVAARSYVIDERETSLGRAEIQVEFTVSDNAAIPEKSFNSISEAATLNEVLGDSLTADIADGFEVDEGLVGNFQDAQDMLNDVSEAFDDVTAVVTAVTTQINQYAANINAFTAKINQLIALPQDLANSVKGIFSTVNALFASVEDTYKAFTEGGFFDFGDGSAGVPQTTQGRVQRAQNRDVINQAVQGFALGFAYVNAAQIQFQTVEDIDAVSVQLDEQYTKLIAAPSVALPGIATPSVAAAVVNGLSVESITALTDLRTLANALLDDQRTEAKKVITVDVQTTPMSVIAYRYYGNTDLADTLLKLNSIKGAAFVNGPIKILTV